jgi:hypothetical protein
MTKLIVSFRNFANAPKNQQNTLFLGETPNNGGSWDFLMVGLALGLMYD